MCGSTRHAHPHSRRRSNYKRLSPIPSPINLATSLATIISDLLHFQRTAIINTTETFAYEMPTTKLAMNTDRVAAVAAAAARAVFNTYELLEQVMLQLPLRDILVQQRVSKQWRAVIQRSHTLQKTLYFKPNGEIIKPSITHKDLDFFTGSTAYISTFRLNPIAGMEDCEGGRWSNKKSFGHFSLSFAARGLLVNQDPIKNPRFVAILISVMPYFLGEYRQDTTPKHATHPNASWRRMFVTKPPITAVHFSFGVYQHSRVDIDDPDEGLCTIWNSTGVTFGELYDAWWKMHADRGNHSPDARYSWMKICLPLPLADGVLIAAVHGCTRWPWPGLFNPTATCTCARAWQEQ